MLPDPDASLFQIKLISKLGPLLPQNIAKSWVLCSRMRVSLFRHGLLFCLLHSATPPGFPSVSPSSTDSEPGQTTGGICLSLCSPLPPASFSFSSACPGLLSHPPVPSSWKGRGGAGQRGKGCADGGEESRVRCTPAVGAQRARPFQPNACTLQRYPPEPCLSFAESEGSSGLMEQQEAIRGSNAYP